jgi:hypothetical protein
MAKPTPPEADGLTEPDADDMPMTTGGAPDGHYQATQRNAGSMDAMQQTFRQQLGKTT